MIGAIQSLADPRTRTEAASGGPSLLPLVLDGVTYEAGGERLLERMDVRFEGRRRTVILGPNGAGKSLLLRLCCGLIRPTAGRVTWAEGDESERRRRTAIVFQRPVLLRRSVAANVGYALAVQGLPRSERRARVDDALAEVGLSALAARPARVLSGGEQQRLQLARAWAQRPAVLFLDEPTANLDPAATRAVETTVAALHRRGVKIVMTTHDLAQARRLADEILFMHRGRVLEQVPAERFFTSPSCPESAAFIQGELLW